MIFILIKTIYIIFLPGFLMSLIFLPKIDFIERLVVSITLSLTIIPSLLIFLNFLGISINLINTLITITSINIIVILIKAGRAHGRLVDKQNNETQN